MAFGIVNMGTKPMSEEQQNPDDKYLSIEAAREYYLKKEDAEGKFLTEEEADNKYLKKTDADNAYLTEEKADEKYLTEEKADEKYLTDENAQVKYLTKDDASKTYLNAENAGNTYLKKAGDTLLGDINANEHTITGLSDPVNDGDAVNKQYLEDSLKKENIGVYVQEDEPDSATENDVWVNTKDKSICTYANGIWEPMTSVSELEKSFISYITEMDISEEGKAIARNNIDAIQKEEKVEYPNGVTTLYLEDNKYYFVNNANDISLVCDTDKTAECRGWITFATRGTVNYEDGNFDFVEDPHVIAEAPNNSKWEFNLSHGCLIIVARTEI